jgi:hypothetical protein
MPAGCTNVLWQWEMIVAQRIMPVKGFNLMVINEDGQLQTQYVEFNSIAWATDTGECRQDCGKHRTHKWTGMTCVTQAGLKIPLAGQVQGATTNSTKFTSAAVPASYSVAVPLLLTGLMASWLASM